MTLCPAHFATVCEGYFSTQSVAHDARRFTNNRGHGLKPAVNLPVAPGGSALSVAVGDLDGDRRVGPVEFPDLDIAVVAGSSNGSNTNIYTLRNDTEPSLGTLLVIAEATALPPDPEGDAAPPLLVVTANVDEAISQSDDVIGLGEQGLGFLPMDTLIVRPTAPSFTGPICDDIDFNNDSSFFDPQDIDAFLSVYGEGSCIPESATCNDIDFNNDTSLFDPCDIDSFLLVFSEGPCTPCGQ